MVYLLPMEILTRMSSTSPFIPYEMGKYIFFFVIIYGLFLNGIKNTTGIYLLVLLLPSSFIGFFVVPNFQDLIFNVLGVINICLGICFFQSLRFKIDFKVHQLARIMTYGLISALVFTVLKTPNYEDIDFSLSANFDTSGGFGSNQVSTAFGLGLFLSFYLWLKNESISGFPKIIDLILAVLFLFQGLLTFSRGGMLGGILGLFLLISS